MVTSARSTTEAAIGRAPGPGVSLPLLAGATVYAASLAWPSRLLADPDTFLHVTVGRWIIAHVAVPDRDLFSHSIPGAPWVPHEWLAQVLITGLYDGMGWAGLAVATALCFAATIAVLARALLRYLEPSHVLIALIGAWGLCYIHMLARPHVPANLLLVLWIAHLVDARAHDRTPRYPLVVLMILWANIHAGFVLGLGFAVLFAGEAVLAAPDPRARRRVAWGWGGFVAASVAAAALTPSGAAGLLLPLRFNEMRYVQSMVIEWRSPDFQLTQPIELWLALALLGALAIGVRLPVTRVAMLLLVLHQALAHRRHAELFGLIAPLLAAPALAPQLRPFIIPALDRRWSALRQPARIGAMALAGVLMLGAGALVIGRGLPHESGRFAPAAAVAAAVEHGVTGPVLNDYGFGDFLLYSGIAPFVDGRVDMYGDAFLRRYDDLAALPALLEQYRIAWTLFPTHDVHVVLLDHLPGWRRLYGDGIAVVHVRDGSPAR